MPVDTPQEVTLPDRPKPAEPAEPSPMQSLLDMERQRVQAFESIFGTTPEIKARMQAQEQKAQAAEATSEAAWGQLVRPAIGRMVEASRMPQPAIPQALPQPPVPDIKPRQFMDVGSKDALQGVISTLGLMAQMAMAGKAPVGALNAMAGAMTGWAEGDAIRAQREWRTYLATVDNIRQENYDNMQRWNAAMKQHGSNQTAAQAEYIAMLAEQGHYDKIAHVAREGMPSAFQQMQAVEQQYDNLRKLTVDLMKHQDMVQLRQATLEQAAEFKRDQLKQQADLARERLHLAYENLGVRREELDIKKQAAAQKAEERQLPSGALLDDLAAQYRNGAALSELVKGWGARSSDLALAIQEKAVEKERQAGNEPGAILLNRRNLQANSSALRQLSVEEARFKSYLTTFEMTVNNARRLSDAVDRSGVPVWDRKVLQLEAQVNGNPAAKDLLAQMEILAREADRVLARGRGVGSEASRQEARRLLDPGMTKEQFHSLLNNVLSTDAMYAAMGFEQEKARLQQAIAHPNQPAAAAKGVGTPPKEGMIRVRRKSDGATGWLDPKDLGDLYEAIK